MASGYELGKVKRGADNPLATISSGSSGEEDSIWSSKVESTCLPQLVHPCLDSDQSEHISRPTCHKKKDKLCKNPTAKKQKSDIIERHAMERTRTEDVFKVPAAPDTRNWVKEIKQIKPKNRFLAKLLTDQCENNNEVNFDPNLTSRPMRERSLPRSFWQQPNKPVDISSSSLFHVLPPIASESHRDNYHQQRKKRKIKVSNLHLLHKLFEVVEDSNRIRQRSEERSLDGQRNLGRLNQLNFEDSPPLMLTNHKENPFGRGALIGGSKDPYLIDPITKEAFQRYTYNQKNTNLVPKVTRHRGGNDSFIYFQSLGVKSQGNESHPKTTFLQEQQKQMSRNTQMLSELVMHI